MKNRLYMGLVLALVLLLCACSGGKPENTAAPPTDIPSTVETAALPTDLPSTAETAIPETTEALPPETTEIAHSDLYLPEYTPQQVFEYFEEVVLHMEFNDGTGNCALVQKWLGPLCYRIYGSPTEEDLAILTALFAQLNEIPGFPGIYAAADEEPENLSIRFLDHEGFRAAFSDFFNGEDAYGGTRFWYYTATNEIHTANVGYRTDIDQSIRTSILTEEIVNLLGISDTVLRTDSIVYQYSNDNTALSDLDWVILKLLYDPAVQCGMDADACREIFDRLYY